MAMSGKYTILYDGQCPFCTARSRTLRKLARHGAIETVDFNQPGPLDSFPGISYDERMQAVHLVAPDGSVYKGIEAAVRAVATRPVLRWIVHLYYLPGVRRLCDLLYRFIAANRYRFGSRK